MSNVKNIICSHNKAQISKPSNHQSEKIAEARILPYLTEIETSGALSIKQRSRLHRQNKHVSFATI